jgi:F0F1-type ATP synthase assembly protein I
MALNTDPEEKIKKEAKENPLLFYAKYSSLALQMGVIIVAGAFGGKALDNYVNWSFPVFTLVLTILSVVIAVFYGIREIFRLSKTPRKKNKKDEL